MVLLLGPIVGEMIGIGGERVCACLVVLPRRAKVRCSA